MAPTWKFAEFELDPGNQELRKHGVAVKLAPLPYKVLLLLVSRSGGLVRREEFHDAVWGQDVNVDFEHGLNTGIRQLRAALGDNADAPRIIATIPRVGYRLMVAASHEEPRRQRIGGARIAAAGVAVIAAASAWVLMTKSERQTIPTPLEAHAYYVRGQVSLDRQTEADTAAARQLFAEAIKRDPTSARARAGLALTYLTHVNALAGLPPAEARARAAEALKEASRLDPAAPEVQAADAQLKLSRSDWKTAEIQFRRSIATAPSDATSHIAYADALALRGRFDEALREAYLAQQLDPLSPRAAAAIASTLRFARRYDEAIVAAEETLRLDPAHGPAFLTLAQCYETKGEFERAIALYQRVGRLSGNLGHAYAVAGRTDEARKLLSVFEQRYKEVGTGAGAIAQIYVGLGDYDRAFEWLQRVVDERGQMSTLKVADVWDPLRSDPRFGTLLVTLGFVE